MAASYKRLFKLTVWDVYQKDYFDRKEGRCTKAKS